MRPSCCPLHGGEVLSQYFRLQARRGACSILRSTTGRRSAKISWLWLDAAVLLHPPPDDCEALFRNVLVAVGSAMDLVLRRLTTASRSAKTSQQWLGAATATCFILHSAMARRSASAAMRRHLSAPRLLVCAAQWRRGSLHDSFRRHRPTDHRPRGSRGAARMVSHTLWQRMPRERHAGICNRLWSNYWQLPCSLCGR